MVIKIGGVEIDKTSDIEEIVQLREGLNELGIDTLSEGVSWLKDLSIEERIDFSFIINEHIADSLISFFTFGLF